MPAYQHRVAAQNILWVFATHIFRVKINDATFDVLQQLDGHQVDVFVLVRNENDIVFVVFGHIVKFIAFYIPIDVDGVHVALHFPNIWKLENEMGKCGITQWSEVHERSGGSTNTRNTKKIDLSLSAFSAIY